MGCAASKDKDPYSIVLQKYGDEKVKEFIISVAKVQFIENNKDKILIPLEQKIASIKNSLSAQLEAARMQIDKKYERSISRIEQANPKAMVAAQKTFKTRIEQLMGYKDVMKKFSDYKEQSKVSIQREQSHTMSYLTNFLKEYEEQLREEVPELKKYQNLEEQQQEMLIKTGKKKYKTSVQKGLDEVQAMIVEKCNFQNFQPKFSTIVTKEKLNQLLNYADRVFIAGQQKIKGATDCKTC